MVFFYGAFGYTLILNPGSDSHSIALDFTYYYALISTSEFGQEIWGIVTLQGGEESADEPYLAVISYLTSRITSDPSWLFLVLGIVYGYFFIKGVNLVYREANTNWNAAAIILFTFFISWVAFYGVNAPRTHTANWVFFCGVFLYLKTNNTKYILLAFSAPLFHFGYLGIMLSFVGYLILKDRKYLYVGILAVSFFASTSMSFLEPALMSTELGQQKIDSYVNNERWDPTIDRGPKEGSFHAIYYQRAARFAIQFMLISSLLFCGYLTGRNHDRLQNGLAAMAILSLSFANFASIIPVLRNRIFMNSALFSLAYLTRLYLKNDNDLVSERWLIYAMFPFILLYIFTMASMTGDYLDFKVIFSPLMYPFIGDDPLSMKEFIRGILDL